MLKQIKSIFKNQKVAVIQSIFIMFVTITGMMSLQTIQDTNVPDPIPVQAQLDSAPTYTVVELDTAPVMAEEVMNLQASGSEYEKVKAQLIKEVDNYILRVAPKSKLSGKVVVEACLEYKRDILFVLAQGHQESHFGTAGMAARTHSVFNVKAYDGRSASNMIAKGDGFSNPNESVRPYLDLLCTKYMVNGKTEQDMLRNFVTVSGKRYARSTTYEADLRSKIQRIKSTTDIYSLQRQLEKLEI